MELIGLAGGDQLRDVWGHAERGKVKDSFTSEVLGRGAVLIRVRRVPGGCPTRLDTRTRLMFVLRAAFAQSLGCRGYWPAPLT